MDDLIRRKDAIDAVISLCDECDYGYCGSCRINYPGEKDAKKALEDLPSAQPEPKWIPCSERLPENSDTVLITHRGGVSVGWHNGRYWERGASTNHRPLTTVLAWMPLPEPWKGEER